METLEELKGNLEELQADVRGIAEDVSCLRGELEYVKNECLPSEATMEKIEDGLYQIESQGELVDQHFHKLREDLVTNKLLYKGDVEKLSEAIAARLLRTMVRVNLITIAVILIVYALVFQL